MNLVQGQSVQVGQQWALLSPRCEGHSPYISLPSWKLTYPRFEGPFEDVPFPQDMLVPRRVWVSAQWNLLPYCSWHISSSGANPRDKPGTVPGAVCLDTATHCPNPFHGLRMQKYHEVSATCLAGLNWISIVSKLHIYILKSQLHKCFLCGSGFFRDGLAGVPLINHDWIIGRAELNDFHFFHLPPSLGLKLLTCLKVPTPFGTGSANLKEIRGKTLFQAASTYLDSRS